MRRRICSYVTALLVGLCLSAGCTDDLPKITLIRQLEPLGARTEVVDAPERTSPRAGEDVRYRIVTALPELAQDRSAFSTLMLECTAPDAETEVAPCQELVELGERGKGPSGAIDLDALGLMLDPEALAALDCEQSYRMQLGPLSLHCAVGEPEFTLSVPKGASGARFVSGVICNRGVAQLDRKRIGELRCGDDPRDELAFFGTVALQPEDEPDNLQLDLDGLRLTLDDEAWDAWPDDEKAPDADDCEDGDLPRVAFEAKRTIGLFYEADKLERVDGERETLELSTYATAGEVERRYTVFDPEDRTEDGELASELEWTAPTKQENDDYKRRKADDPVRFYVAARDLRGGFSVREYYLCLD